MDPLLQNCMWFSWWLLGNTPSPFLVRQVSKRHYLYWSHTKPLSNHSWWQLITNLLIISSEDKCGCFPEVHLKSDKKKHDAGKTGSSRSFCTFILVQAKSNGDIWQLVNRSTCVLTILTRLGHYWKSKKPWTWFQSCEHFTSCNECAVCLILRLKTKNNNTSVFMTGPVNEI